ncbi:LysR family transcriptional regulator [Paraburkholderia caballeronis]|uniref:LysR family transcriptional regulator n=1 Tax=Paraburkholderia caballeronis TaxID=416943 RepID=UPI001064DB71|nr:LysR substrate-binding domain-containing protein [Paraburkholderia caballeronis]TDV35758.1 LysR family transcriptional regulator [Paraburkholderia caballeronis]
MELRLLRAFLAIAELRHYGRASDALHLSQPALSKQIAVLEAQLGAKLFERGRHGAELTTFGAAFVADARALVRDADEVLARARAASSGRRGHLRVGLGLSTLTFAPRLIAGFREQHPDVNVTLHDLSSAGQTERLLADKLDVGFVRLPAADGLSAFAVLDESLALALPQHVRWRRVPADAARLNEPGFVALTRSRGPGLAAQVDRWCAAHGFAPRVIQHADDIQTVLASVAAGVGAAFLPSRAQYLLRDARVLPLRDAAAQWRVGLAWRADRDDAVVERFVAFVKAAVRRGDLPRGAVD